MSRFLKNCPLKAGIKFYGLNQMLGCSPMLLEFKLHLCKLSDTHLRGLFSFFSSFWKNSILDRNVKIDI
jgi:hypothetical protein